MKKIVNSALLVVSLLLVSNVFLSSCEKDKDDPEKVSIPLIASVNSYDENGELDYSESYQYDNHGRLIKMENNENIHITMEYAGSTVILKTFGGDELNGTNTAHLNSKGLCTSISSEENEDMETYAYDSNGYRISWINKNGNYITSSLFTVSEGNITSSIFTDQPNTENSALAKNTTFLKSSSLIANLQKRIVSENRHKSATAIYMIKTDFEFYKDKINTIELENLGISFFGKQNKNPIKQETDIVTYDGESFEPGAIIYTYEYDSKNRITKQLSSDGDYSVFTYVD